MPYLSALEVWSRQGAIQIHVHLYLYLSWPSDWLKDSKESLTCSNSSWPMRTCFEFWSYYFVLGVALAICTLLTQYFLEFAIKCWPAYICTSSGAASLTTSTVVLHEKWHIISYTQIIFYLLDYFAGLVCCDGIGWWAVPVTWHLQRWTQVLQCPDCGGVHVINMSHVHDDQLSAVESKSRMNWHSRVSEW